MPAPPPPPVLALPAFYSDIMQTQIQNTAFVLSYTEAF